MFRRNSTLLRFLFSKTLSLTMKIIYSILVQNTVSQPRIKVGTFKNNHGENNPFKNYKIYSKKCFKNTGTFIRHSLHGKACCVLIPGR